MPWGREDGGWAPYADFRTSCWMLVCLRPDIWLKTDRKRRGQIWFHVTKRQRTPLWHRPLWLWYVAVHIHGFIKWFDLSICTLRWLQDKLSNVSVFTPWHFSKNRQKTKRSNLPACDSPPTKAAVTYSFVASLCCSKHSRLYKIVWCEHLGLQNSVQNCLWIEKI